MYNMYKFCSYVLIGTERDAILFLYGGDATISGVEQPIKLREKHYPPPEYMLKSDNTTEWKQNTRCCGTSAFLFEIANIIGEASLINKYKISLPFLWL
jgi:hypothetical protein